MLHETIIQTHNDRNDNKPLNCYDLSLFNDFELDDKSRLGTETSGEQNKLRPNHERKTRQMHPQLEFQMSEPGKSDRRP